MENKKIIHILLLHLKMGGIEVCTINLANALAKNGFSVVLDVCLKTNYFTHNEIDEKVKVNFLTKYESDSVEKKSNMFKKFFRRKAISSSLKKLIKSLNDITVISTRNEYSVLLSKYANKSVLKIAQLHHDYVGYKIENDFKHNYKNIDYFVHLTDEVRNEIENMIRPFNKHTKVIAIPNFLPNKKNENANNQKRKNVALAVGRLSLEKGFLRLIEIWKAVNLLKQPNENFQLLIVGEGDERKNIEEAIRNFGLETSVSLLGLKDNEYVTSLMQQAKVYCMTSLTEAFSMVLLESLENGLPQVAYDVRVGPRNLILEGKTGFLIDENNSKEYAERILSIFRDEELFVKMSEASKNRFENFTEEKVISRWMDIIIGEQQ